jgi:transcriptional regulator with XRE-family HTH domain
MLTDARQKAALTQMDLGERIGKPQSYVSKFESGERRLDVVEFIAVARAIGVDPVPIFKSVVRFVGETRP